LARPCCPVLTCQPRGSAASTLSPDRGVGFSTPAGAKERGRPGLSAAARGDLSPGLGERLADEGFRAGKSFTGPGSSSSVTNFLMSGWRSCSHCVHAQASAAPSRTGAPPTSCSSNACFDILGAARALFTRFSGRTRMHCPGLTLGCRESNLRRRTQAIRSKLARASRTWAKLRTMRRRRSAETPAGWLTAVRS